MRDHEVFAEEQVREYMINACVQSARIAGYSDAVGVLRGVIMLALEPISMDDLVETTGYSKSTISSNMNLLETLGLVMRIVTPGDKKYRYLPVTDADTLRRAIMNRVKVEIHLLLQALEISEKTLVDANFPELEALQDRIVRMETFYRKAEQAIDLMERYDTDQLIALLKGSCND
ncbi:MAG: hypothetical protein A4E45_00632 [Methanosaeta sp. PtaB.Bin039]|nr:MAG: hypothetical protein A4E45_00632 [Methanosaeta sp. PtaB.Bin039]OPY47110.1 MAG: hypothetical protein A4E47_00377 [Methanosaeta sp. PtaU1.Bin028]